VGDLADLRLADAAPPADTGLRSPAVEIAHVIHWAIANKMSRKLTGNPHQPGGSR
jgi:hypothetical protein